MTYQINEVFASLQGEGVRAGKASVFLRFAGCNMRCRMEESRDSPGGFDCDTEFTSGRKMSAAEILWWIFEVQKTGPKDCKTVVLTGGEPLLQLDQDLVDTLKREGFELQLETNGSIELGIDGIDCVTVSPKVAEHCLRIKRATEVKYVRGYGQALPRTTIEAEHYWISPAFCGLSLESKTLEWCKKLVAESGGKWKLSVQQHKIWGIQ